MNVNDILKLSPIATERLGKMIISQVSNNKNPLKEIVPRTSYIEYYFNDGTFIELAVVRDFNDDMNPTHVVLNEYVKVKGHHGFTSRYNRLYTERFEVSQKSERFFE